MTARDPVVGVVSEWHAEAGWGVFASPQTPGGCWCHFSHLSMPGFRSLERGVGVEFTFEEADQDGYCYRAIEAWPTGQRHPPQVFDMSGDASFSTLTISADPTEGTS